MQEILSQNSSMTTALSQRHTYQVALLKQNTSLVLEFNEKVYGLLDGSRLTEITMDKVLSHGPSNAQPFWNFLIDCFKRTEKIGFEVQLVIDPLEKKINLIQNGSKSVVLDFGGVLDVSSLQKTRIHLRQNEKWKTYVIPDDPKLTRLSETIRKFVKSESRIKLFKGEFIKLIQADVAKIGRTLKLQKPPVSDQSDAMILTSRLQTEGERYSSTTHQSRSQVQHSQVNQSRYMIMDSNIYPPSNYNFDSINQPSQITVKSSNLDLNKGKTGLNNLGNTCYLNASTQCLAQIRYLVNVCVRPLSNPDNKVTDSFSKILAGIWKGQVTINEILNFQQSFQLKAPHMKSNQQHDASEFTSSLLNIIHDELNKVKTVGRFSVSRGNVDSAEKSWAAHLSQNKSIIVDLFHGQFEKNIQCPLCGYKTNVYQQYMVLPLPMLKNTNQAGHSEVANNLYDCFDYLEQPEVFREDSLWRCEKCQKNVAPQTQSFLTHTPRYLILSLSKFQTSKRGAGQKIQKHIDFPIRGLNLQKYVKNSDSKQTYNLTGVVYHFGNLQSGHYTAIVKHYYDEKFYQYDDTRINLIRNERDIVTENAYLLFYEKTSTF